MMAPDVGSGVTPAWTALVPKPCFSLLLIARLIKDGKGKKEEAKAAAKEKSKAEAKEMVFVNEIARKEI